MTIEEELEAARSANRILEHTIHGLRATIRHLSSRLAYYEFTAALDDEPRDRAQLRELAALIVRDEGDL